MKYFLDTEFFEDGKRIELISIGVVCEDGREFYKINHSAPWQLILRNKWLRENVVTHLPIVISEHKSSSGVKFNRWDRAESPHWGTPQSIAVELREFVQGEYPDLEMWAYYGDYDWVATCRLFGRMLDLPPTWPRFCYDLRQWLNHGGHGSIRQPDDAPHNALEDARWVAATHKKYDMWTLNEVYIRQGTNENSKPVIDWESKYRDQIIELTDTEYRLQTEIKRLNDIIDAEDLRPDS